mmetsp:Transcript_13772/g.45308  ORF Transcript_13772/g.45308 Transcript_13772/m.45308 type:complete len:94 (+) Transcript_13772:668-949(+)
MAQLTAYGTPAQPTAFPADGKPVFLGATRGHAPIDVLCPRCGFSGSSRVERKWGAAAVMFSMFTFGLGAICAPKDTWHYCPQCSTALAYAKLA